MKTCSKCKKPQEFNCFQINDYGRHVSQCNGCCAEKALANYYKRKGTSNPNTGLDISSNDTKIKCKNFFFYEHVL